MQVLSILNSVQHRARKSADFLCAYNVITAVEKQVSGLTCWRGRYIFLELLSWLESLSFTFRFLAEGPRDSQWKELTTQRFEDSRLWDMTPYRWVIGFRRLEGNYRFHIQGSPCPWRRISFVCVSFLYRLHLAKHFSNISPHDPELSDIGLAKHIVPVLTRHPI